MKRFLLTALALLTMTPHVEAAQTHKSKVEQVKKMAAEQGLALTFEMNPDNIKYATGLKKPVAGTKKPKKDKSFLNEEIRLPRHFQLAEHLKNTEYSALCGIYNQGNCGSCVYNSAAKNWCDYLRVHNYKQDGVKVPDYLSRQQLMSCTNGGRCNGEWMLNVGGKYLPQIGGLYDEAVFPYKASSSSSCQKPANATLFGKGLPIKGKEIENSAKSMFTALYQGFPVSVTVGADNAWMAYSTGVYNYCSNAGTNHEVLLYGWDCEDSFEVIDGKEYCVFPNGKDLPNGAGVIYIPNSWGTSWGEQGIMRSRLKNSGGRLCNNIAEEAVILDGGLAMPTPPVPPTPGPGPVPPTPTPFSIPSWVWIVLAAFGGAGLVLVITKLRK